MKAIRATLATLAAGLVLAGCNTTGQVVSPTPESIQQAIINGCGFYEPISVLAKILASFVPIPGVSTVTALADEVCAAEIPPTASAGRMMATPKPVVRGVQLQGVYVGKP